MNRTGSRIAPGEEREEQKRTEVNEGDVPLGQQL
jgi:hypothetical protein